jgi:hypothetical protein
MKSATHQLADLAGLAIEAIRTLLSSPDTPPSARFRAAKFVLESISTPADSAHDEAPQPVPPPRPSPKIGRNDYCPCGSGLKFKKCCLNKPELQATTPGNVFDTPPAR